MDKLPTLCFSLSEYDSLANAQEQLPPPYFFPMNRQDQQMNHSMPPPQSPSIPIDPALSLYSPYYSYQQQSPQSHIPPHLSLPNYSSPSSGGSETLGTPPTESAAFMSVRKRPAPAVNGSGSDSRKKPRKDDEDESQSPVTEKEEVKAKPTRGSR
jgi:hypothetical protein